MATVTRLASLKPRQIGKQVRNHVFSTCWSIRRNTLNGYVWAICCLYKLCIAIKKTKQGKTHAQLENWVCSVLHFWKCCWEKVVKSRCKRSAQVLILARWAANKTYSAVWIFVWDKIFTATPVLSYHGFKPLSQFSCWSCTGQKTSVQRQPFKLSHWVVRPLHTCQELVADGFPIECLDNGISHRHIDILTECVPLQGRQALYKRKRILRLWKGSYFLHDNWWFHHCLAGAVGVCCMYSSDGVYCAPHCCLCWWQPTNQPTNKQTWCAVCC